MPDHTTVVDVLDRIAAIQERLEELIEDHFKAGERFHVADSAYEAAFLSAHIASMEEHPERTVGAHNSYARYAALDQYKELQGAKALENVIRHAMHSLRAVLSAWQTTGKFTADAAGHGAYGRGR